MARERYGTIVIVGGGCYGAYYVRQLRRAMAARALACERLLVVDRDPACRLATTALADETLDAEAARDIPEPELVAAEWSAFFADYLARAARAGENRDAIVPSPLMPHLMYEWLLRRARERWPDRQVETRSLAAAPPVPWERAAPDGTHYVSFAEWMCPVNCVEPATCPHTRDRRWWSLPSALGDWVAAERRTGRPLVGPIIFHCRHRAYGVGMFDTSEVLAGDRMIADVAAYGAADVLVGTTSHCHGALNVLAIGAPVHEHAITSPRTPQPEIHT